MFEFTKQLELAVRSVLNTKFICKYSGQDLRDVIERKIMKAWNVLSRSITNETLTNSAKSKIGNGGNSKTPQEIIETLGETWENIMGNGRKWGNITLRESP